MTQGWPAGMRSLVLALALALALGLWLALGLGLAHAAPSARPATATTAPGTGGACSTVNRGAMVAEGADLVLRDDAGLALARWPLRNAQGQPGTLLAVCSLPLRHSHVIVVQGWTELWEISHDPTAPPIYDGLVHDWRMREGIPRPGYLGIRRFRLERPWVAVFSDGRQPWLIGAEAADDGTLTAVVLNLDIRRALARMPLPADGGWPDLAGRRWP